MNNMSSIEEDICKNVKYYRTQLQMTQKDVANILKITLSSYQKLEQGQRHFSTSQLFELSQIFDVNIACLYYRDNFDIKTNYKEQPSKTLKINIQKIFRCFGIEDYSIKDISALINLINRRGKGFLYVSKIRADFWQYSYDRQKGEEYLLEKAKWGLDEKMQKLEAFYRKNLPGINEEIAELIMHHKSLIKKKEDLISDTKELEQSLETKQEKLRYLNESIRTADEKMRERAIVENDYIQKEREALNAQIIELNRTKSKLCSDIEKFVPLEQYINNPESLPEDIFNQIRDCIPIAIQDKVDDMVYDMEDKLDDCQWTISVFEEYGFDTDDISVEKIDEFIKEKIRIYCKEKYQGWTLSKIRKATYVLFQYIKKYGLLDEYKEKDKNLPPRYTTPEEILNYYLKYH